MPLFYQHNINEHTKLAVWHITENEDFFLEKVPLQTKVTHPHKRVQHLAARYLLELLQPGFPYHLIEIADSNKPLLANEEFHFSLSHCGDFAAAIVSEKKLVGIDVELITSKVEKIKNKFLSQNEIGLLPECNAKFLTLCWSAKEAIYKWYGKGKVDFKNNIFIDDLALEQNEGVIKTHFEKEERTDLKVGCRFFGNLWLAWV
jgi:phosphopantetheinyl transferase